MAEFTQRAQNLMNGAFGEPTEFPMASWAPAVDVSEQKDEFTVMAELPGLAQKDIAVDFSDGMLTISGEKLEEKKEEKDDRKYYRYERRFGSFQRVLPFPGGIDESKIAAEFKDGVLTVHLPKNVEEKAKRRTIPVITK
jgi:HSP20 family protein